MGVEKNVQEAECLRREEVIGAMDIIPNDMDFNDGCVLLDILYTIRHLTGNIRNLSLLEFQEKFVLSLATDPITGRITKLHLRYGVSRDDDGRV